MKAGLFTYKDDEGVFGSTDKLRSIVRDGTGGTTGCVNNGQQKAATSPATRHFNNAGTTGKSTPKKNNTNPKNTNNDGLLGGLLLQCLIGVPMLDAFSHAANMPVALEPAEICHAVEFADEIMTDRAKPRADFKICEGGKLGSTFNMRRLPAQPRIQTAPENDNDAQLRQLVTANGQGSHAVAMRLKP